MRWSIIFQHVALQYSKFLAHRLFKMSIFQHVASLYGDFLKRRGGRDLDTGQLARFPP